MSRGSHVSENRRDMGHPISFAFNQPTNMVHQSRPVQER